MRTHQATITYANMPPQSIAQVIRNGSDQRVCTTDPIWPESNHPGRHQAQRHQRRDNDPFLEAMHGARRKPARVQSVVDPDPHRQVPEEYREGQEMEQGKHALPVSNAYTCETLAWTSRIVSTVSSSCSKRNGL